VTFSHNGSFPVFLTGHLSEDDEEDGFGGCVAHSAICDLRCIACSACALSPARARACAPRASAFRALTRPPLSAVHRSMSDDEDEEDDDDEDDDEDAPRGGRLTAGAMRKLMGRAGAGGSEDDDEDEEDDEEEEEDDEDEEDSEDDAPPVKAAPVKAAPASAKKPVAAAPAAKATPGKPALTPSKAPAAAPAKAATPAARKAAAPPSDDDEDEEDEEDDEDGMGAHTRKRRRLHALRMLLACIGASHWAFCGVLMYPRACLRCVCAQTMRMRRAATSATTMTSARPLLLLWQRTHTRMDIHVLRMRMHTPL
jgi:hypothetical protein